MIFCTYCGRGFSRSEHVQRHVLTHTKVRPFECSICHLTFTRRELVQKHYRSHGEEVAAEKQNEANASSVGRPRTAVACMNCARSKTKCDHKYPCNRCQSKGLQCVSRKARRSASGAPTTSPQMDLSGMDMDVPQGSDEQNGSISTASPGTPSGHVVDSTEASHQNPNPPDIINSSNLENPTILDPQLFGPEEISIDWSKMFSPSQWQFTTSITSGIDLDISKTPHFQTPPDPFVNNSAGSVGHTPSVTRRQAAYQVQPSPDTALFIASLEQHSPLSVDVFTGGTDHEEAGNNEAKPRDWEFWTLAQCIPFPTAIPVRRDKENISLFAESCRRWSTGKIPMKTTGMQSIESARLTESTRERVSAIVQGVFHTAQETHGITINSNHLDFLPLPPTEALYEFLMNYLHHCDPYYPFVPKRSLNPNHLISTSSSRGPTLLLLLMIGFGAMMDPSPSARQIVCGLMEICRLSHMERMDKQGTVVTEPAMTVQCGLIYTVQAAWSGEKWQMDIGVGHRHMYLTILRNIRFFSPPEVGWSDAETQYNIEQLWAEWTDHETRSRLIYTWVIVDQELSLFYDTPPLLSITELEGPVPDDDALWLATSPSEWKQALQVSDDSTDAAINALRSRPRSSLRDLFHFLSSNDLQRPEMTSLGPLQLRLLLYPLHALVCNFHQSLGLSTTMNQPLKLHKTMTQMSTMLQHAEIKSLLHRWRELSDRGQPARTTPAARALDEANLVLYHLINLNLFTSLKDIESHARSAAAAASLQDSWLCAAEEVLVHCGQVLRLLRAMDASRRPIWWAAAGYRAAVVLWAHSVSGGGAAASAWQGPACVAVDRLPVEDAALQRFWRQRQGVPRLTAADGSAVALEEPGAVLRTCVEAMELRPMGCLVWEGIRCKLEAMARACGAGG